MPQPVTLTIDEAVGKKVKTNKKGKK
jgi:hypothetical protein